MHDTLPNDRPSPEPRAATLELEMITTAGWSPLVGVEPLRLPDGRTLDAVAVDAVLMLRVVSCFTEIDPALLRYRVRSRTGLLLALVRGDGTWREVRR